MLANIVGTTGASMLLIRPWIRLNQNRIRPFHVVFFIFIVSNIGGSLTPIGDPPLFLGYLKGVPFWWVLNNCWPAWILGVGFLVATFVYLDWRNCSGHGCVLCRHVHHLPECFRRHRLYSFGVLLAKMVAQFVPCDAVAPPPKFLVGVAFEIFQADGDGLQNFLQGVFGGFMGNAAENKHAQVRLNAAEDFFRQPDALGQSRREAVGANKFESVTSGKAGGYVKSVNRSKRFVVSVSRSKRHQRQLIHSLIFLLLFSDVAADCYFVPPDR